MRRFTLAVLVVLGVGLIVAPFSLSMFSRADKGAQMVTDFRPIMQPANVQTTADYYYNTFVKLRPVALAMTPQTINTFSGYVQGIKAMEQDLAKMPPAQMQALAAQYPAMGAMLKGTQQMEQSMSGFVSLMAGNLDTFKNVPAGLDHYKPLVDTMQANVGNYSAIDALPSMRFFPWFFIVPGLIALLAAAYLLVGDVKPTWVWPRLDRKAGTPVAH